MMLDIVLAFLAIALATVGTLTEKPSLRIKTLPISLDVLVAVGTVFKSRSDDVDESPMEAALLTSLNPPAGFYGKLDDGIGKAGIPRG
jgi:hypothetical protein